MAMSTNIEVAPGQEYTLWTVVSHPFQSGRRGTWRVSCECYCGTRKDVIVSHLINERSRSCGCYATYKSERANNQLKDIWLRMLTEEWNAYVQWLNDEAFRRWALYAGFRINALLHRRCDTFGFTETNCFWDPIRKPRGRKSLEVVANANS